MIFLLLSMVWVKPTTLFPFPKKYSKPPAFLWVHNATFTDLKHTKLPPNVGPRVKVGLQPQLTRAVSITNPTVSPFFSSTLAHYSGPKFHKIPGFRDWWSFTRETPNDWLLRCSEQEGESLGGHTTRGRDEFRPASWGMLNQHLCITVNPG